MIRFVFWSMTGLLALMLTACGFQLRGLGDTARPYPFTSLYIDSSLPVAAQVAAIVRLDPRVKLLTSAQHADAVLRIVSENKDKVILTIDRSGTADEYRLNYKVAAQLFMRGEQVGDVMVVKQFRDMTYSENQVLGKGQEENLLWADMLQGTAQQLLYRMSSDRMNHAVAAANGSASAPATKAPNAVGQP